jgi:serine/threonine-protein kinase
MSSGPNEEPSLISPEHATAQDQESPGSAGVACAAPPVIRRRKPKPKERYVIERLIGQGGMGAVYKARDVELERMVAIKLLHPCSLDESAEQRLKQELVLASKVSHPRVVRVHDVGEMHGAKFISMAFIDGENLKSLLVREGAIPVARAIHIASQLCEGLDAAHTQGVIHRDLKPHNILLDRNGYVYISDFGLARSADLNAEVTGPGDRPGSPAYMSPEQALGLPFDHRTDLYALGLVFYEMVTGKLPASATSLFEHERFQCKIESPAALSPEVPESLARLILRCLEFDPARRPQSALEILRELKLLSAASQASVKVLKRRSKKLLAGLAFALLVFGVLAILSPVAARLTGNHVHAGSGPHRPGSQLSFTPLRAIGDARSLHVLADTLTEALSSRAAQSGRVRLFVEDADTQDVGAEHPPGVGVAITGSVRAEGNEILATIHLTDRATREEKWTGQFRASPGNLATLEDRIWAGISNALGWNEADPQPMPSLLHATQNIEAYKLYMQGKLQLRMHRNRAGAEHALLLFQEASRLDPRYFYPYVGLADANLVIFKETHENACLERAKQAASRALELSLNRPEPQIEVAKIQIATGQYPEAIGVLKMAIEKNPASDEAYRTLGRAELLSGNGQGAILAYRKAVDLDAHSWMNYNSLGSAYFRLGQTEEAERAFQKAIELEPQISDNYTNRGNALLQSGRFQEAVPLLEKAVALQPDAVNYSNLGTALFYLRHYRESVSMFQKAVQVDPNSEDLMGNLGDSYRWSNDKSKAMAAYFRAVVLGGQELQVNPQDADVRGRMALYYAKMDDFEAARASILTARSLAPQDTSVQYYEAVVSTLGSNLARAERELKSAVKNGYPQPLAMNDPELLPLHPDAVLGQSRSRSGQ